MALEEGVWDKAIANVTPTSVAERRASIRWRGETQVSQLRRTNPTEFSQAPERVLLPPSIVRLGLRGIDDASAGSASLELPNNFLEIIRIQFPFIR